MATFGYRTICLHTLCLAGLHQLQMKKMKIPDQDVVDSQPADVTRKKDQVVAASQQVAVNKVETRIVNKVETRYVSKVETRADKVTVNLYKKLLLQGWA